MERIHARRQIRTSNEIVTILNELLRQGAITRDEYKQLNIMLAESIDEEMDLELDSEDEFKKMIQPTTKNVMDFDQKELMEIVTVLKEEVTEDYTDAVFQLEKLFKEFFINEYLDGKLILPMVDEFMKTLEGYALTKSKQQRLKRLTDDIKSN